MKVPGWSRSVARPTDRDGRGRMRRWRSSRPLRVVAGALVVTSLLVTGLLRLQLDTGVRSFLPSSSRSADELESVQRAFGGDPVVVLMTAPTDGALLSKDHLPELLRLEGELAGLPDVAVVYGPATVLNQIAGQSQQLLARISGRRDGLRDLATSQALKAGASPQQAAAAGAAAIVDFDRRYGALLAGGLNAGLPTLNNPSFVRAVAYDRQGLPNPQFRFVLPSPRSVAVLVRPREGLNQFDTERLVRAVRTKAQQAKLGPVDLKVTGAPVLSAALADRVRSELPLLGGLAVLAVGLVLFLTGRGPRRRRLLPLAVAVAATVSTLAILGLVGLPLSLGMLALMPILVGIGNNYPIYLAEPARRRTVAVLGVASAMAFGSLAISPLPFVRGLGIALAVGVLCSLALALLLNRKTGGADPVDESGDESGDVSGGVSAGVSSWTDQVTSVGPASLARPTSAAGIPSARRGRIVALLVVGCLVAGIGWWRLPSLPVEASLQSSARGLPALTEAASAERVLGATGEIDVVLRGQDVLTPESLRWSEQAAEALVVKLGDRVRLLASPGMMLGFLGPNPTAGQILAATDLLPPYLLGAAVQSDRRESVLTLGIRIADLGAVSDLLRAVRSVLPPPPPGSTVVVAGLPVVAVDGYQALSRERLMPNVLALLVLGGVAALGLRRRRDALWAFLAAALAAGWGFAIVAALGIGVSPVTASLGAITAAVGCEFTVLAVEARRSATPLVGRAVAVAAATGAAGFLTLLASDLRLIAELGLVLTGALVLAYLAARLVSIAVVAPNNAARNEEVALTTDPSGTVGTQPVPASGGVQ